MATGRQRLAQAQAQQQAAKEQAEGLEVEVSDGFGYRTTPEGGVRPTRELLGGGYDANEQQPLIIKPGEPGRNLLNRMADIFMPRGFRTQRDRDEAEAQAQAEAADRRLVELGREVRNETTLASFADLDRNAILSQDRDQVNALARQYQQAVQLEDSPDADMRTAARQFLAQVPAMQAALLEDTENRTQAQVDQEFAAARLDYQNVFREKSIREGVLEGAQHRENLAVERWNAATTTAARRQTFQEYMGSSGMDPGAIAAVARNIGIPTTNINLGAPAMWLNELNEHEMLALMEASRNANWETNLAADARLAGQADQLVQHMQRLNPSVSERSVVVPWVPGERKDFMPAMEYREPAPGEPGPRIDRVLGTPIDPDAPPTSWKDRLLGRPVDN